MAHTNARRRAFARVHPSLRLNSRRRLSVGVTHGELANRMPTSKTPSLTAPGQAYRLPVSREAAIAHAPVAMCVLEGPQLVVRFVSDAFRALAGERDLLGRTAVEALPRLAATGVLVQAASVLRSGEGARAVGLPMYVDTGGDGAPEERFV